jgi:phage terminase large subunit-like protein
MKPHHRYALDVVNGNILTNKLTKQACQRYLDDVDHAHERGFYFDDTKVDAVIRFFERVLKHSKGRWAGQPIILEEWEKFIVANLFGWHDEEGNRRFNIAYIEMGRKNGKTLLVSGIGLFMLLLDGEGGAEVYSSATTREQARLAHSEAVRMVKQSPALSKELHLVRDNISHLKSFSKMEPLSSPGTSP